MAPIQNSTEMGDLNEMYHGNFLGPYPPLTLKPGHPHKHDQHVLTNSALAKHTLGKYELYCIIAQKWQALLAKIYHHH